MEYKIKGGELIFKVCPECGNSNWNLQVSLKEKSAGMVHCWACELKGKVNKLVYEKRDFREIYRIFLLQGVVVSEGTDKERELLVPEGFGKILFCEEKKIIEYLEKRGLSIKEAAELGVRFRFPYILFELNNSFYKYWVMKNIETERYTMPEVPKTEIVWHISHQSDDVLIVEGIFDGVKAWQAGYDAIVLMGKVLHDKAFKYIVNVLGRARIHVALDQDAPQYSMKLAEELNKKGIEVFMFPYMESEEGADIGCLSIDVIRERVAKRIKYDIKQKMKLKFKK
jgi:hypothetical protein